MRGGLLVHFQFLAVPVGFDELEAAHVGKVFFAAAAALVLHEVVAVDKVNFEAVEVVGFVVGLGRVKHEAVDAGHYIEDEGLVDDAEGKALGGYLGGVFGQASHFVVVGHEGGH